ncbi:MAG: glycosyltransferase family 39 protein [Elusimicrobiota bacterium]|jgi:hypothetical protein
MSGSRPFAALAAAALFLQGALGLYAARTHSAVYDEPLHLAAGCVLWRLGDARLTAKNPPLAVLLLSAPLRTMRVELPLQSPEWAGSFGVAFAERMLFWSGNDADGLLLRARAVNLLLSLLLSAALWAFARRRWGDGPAALAAALYAFSPSLLAHSALATSDMTATFFLILAFLALCAHLEKPAAPRAAAAGLCAAAAVLCKHTAVLFWPAAALATAAWTLGRRDGFGRARTLLAWGLLPWAAVVAVYLALSPGGWGSFLDQVSQVREIGHPSFLLGRLSRDGRLAYYAVAFLVKSTPVEVLAAAALLLRLLRVRGRSDAASLVAFSGAAVYLLVASLSHKQLGIRYVLPLYPLLALSAAPAARETGRRWAPALVLAGVLQAGAAFAAAPHHLSYFNVFAGGPAGGHRFLADSNLDWGQDLRRLRAFVEEQGQPELILSYFGTASPEYYGIRAQRFASTNAIQLRWRNSEKPRREFLVVSRTNLQGVYDPPGPRLSWLKDRAPTARLGWSLLIYDVTADAEAHRRLARGYAELGDAALAAHEDRRAAVIRCR